jgi:hypothetical protein
MYVCMYVDTVSEYYVVCTYHDRHHEVHEYHIIQMPLLSNQVNSNLPVHGDVAVHLVLLQQHTQHLAVRRGIW